MTRRRLMLLALLVVANVMIIAFAWRRAPVVVTETPVAPPAAVLPKAPKLVADATSAQLGSGDPEQIMRHTFVVRNEGTGPLRLSNVRADKTQVAWGHVVPQIVAPNQEAKLVANLRLGRQAGTTRGEVILETNDPERPALAFSVEGETRPRVEVSPKRLELGPIAAGKTGSGVFEVRSRAGLSLKVVETRSSSDKVTAEVEEVEPGQHFRVRVSVAAPAQPGPFAGWVHLVTDQPGSYHLIAIAVVARVVAAKQGEGGAGAAAPGDDG